MKNFRLISFLLAMLFIAGTADAQKGMFSNVDGKSIDKYEVDYRIDAMKYWKHMAKLGLVELNPEVPVKKAVYTSSKIRGKGLVPVDSPDIPVTDNANSTQSENSIFINPNDIDKIINSNNSTSGGTLYGTSGLLSNDGAATWGGSIQGTGGDNSGDPATVIGNNGTYYVGHITDNLGQGIAISTDQGQTWNAVQVAPPPGGMFGVLDKNHLWIDNSTSSPFEGNLYDAYTPFGGTNDSQIEFTRSTDGGYTWSAGIAISNNIAAGSHNQGVNIHTGPYGEVYAVWAVYDNSGSDETALGFARSYDGGISFLPATRIISNIRGIRDSETSKAMRVNSFPVMAVDISSGPFSGNIYVVWTNIGVPGINTGNDIDVYMLKSTDQGSSWSNPIRINQDPVGLGNEHFFPWIACDPDNGTLSVVFYDDRNMSSQFDTEVFVAVSTDAGNTWNDFKVSDVSFTPSPIPGLASDYFGDYIGISARDRRVYPCWTDNRTGYAMTWVSPFVTGPPPDQPYIVYSSHSVNDASGNNNGRLDFGETVNLDVAMVNIGDEPAYNVDVKLASSDPFIQIIDSTANYGNFNVGDTVMVTSAYSIRASDTIPNGHAIVFQLIATDGDSIWHSNFSVEAYAPAIAIGNMTIYDPSGNNNGRLDPGETVDIHIKTFNVGSFDLTNVIGTLSSSSSDITINSSTHTFSSLLMGSSDYAIFNITVNTGVPPATIADLNYNVQSGAYYTMKTFTPKIGLILEDWETGDFTRFPWTDAGNAPWIITNVGPAEGQYCAKSGNITHNQTSVLQVNLDVLINDSISFLRKVSSEYTYDFLEFYIDNTLQDAWSGVVDWGRVSFPVTAGNHTFKWVYTKDFYVSAGSDCAWIDYIVFPPIQNPSTPLSVTAMANPQQICEGESSQLYTFPLGGSGNYTFQWTPSTGLSNPTIPDPVASPLTTTTYKVLVDDGTDTTSANVMLIVNAKPVVSFDTLSDVCVYWPPFQLSGGTPVNGEYFGIGITNGYFDPSVAGVGTHTLTYSYVDPQTACSDTAFQTIHVDQCAGIGENVETLAINIYPNPNNGSFILELNSEFDNSVMLKIIDPIGILVYEEDGIIVNGETTRNFNFEDLAAGVYFLNVFSKDIRYVKRIVIQK